MQPLPARVASSAAAQVVAAALDWKLACLSVPNIVLGPICSGRAIGPFVAFAPMWMWAAMIGPLRPV